MVKVRVHGTAEEIRAFTEWLEEMPRVEVLSTSDNYADRGKSKYERVYLDVRLKSIEECVQGKHD